MRTYLACWQGNFGLTHPSGQSTRLMAPGAYSLRPIGHHGVHGVRAAAIVRGGDISSLDCRRRLHDLRRAMGAKR
jgi:hypothetical protein